MMSFSQFQILQNQLLLQATTPKANWAQSPSARFGNVNNFYRHLVGNTGSNWTREIHINPESGEAYEFQYSFAKPLGQS